MTLAFDLVTKSNETTMMEWTEALEPDRVVTAVVHSVLDISYQAVEHVFQGIMPPPSPPDDNDNKDNQLRVQLHRKILHRLHPSNVL